MAQGLATLLPKTSTDQAVPPKAQFCHLLNITQCEVSENADSFIVNVYNPLPRSLDKFVRLPVQGTNFEVKCPCGHEVPSQVIPIPRPVVLIPGKKSINKPFPNISLK